MVNNDGLNPDFVEQEQEQSWNVRETMYKYLYHWPVFILGLLICILGAALYLRYAQPVYSVNSTLLIKDDKKGVVPGGDLLNELELFGSSKVVDNEIEILKSKTLMRKVVDRLNLSVSFLNEGHLKNFDVYSNLPFAFRVVQMSEDFYGKDLLLSFPTNNSYKLEDGSSGYSVTGSIGILERNKFGLYKVDINNPRAKLIHLKLSMKVNDPTFVTDQCLKKLTVALAGKQSTVLNLGFETTVPKRGQDILNVLVQVYNEAALIDKNKTIESTIQFIDERLKLITGELSEVEGNVEKFKSSRGLTDISNDASIFLENVKANDAKLNEINLQISIIKNISRFVDSYSPEEKLPSTLGINDPVLLGQITQLSELQLRHNQLLATTTENNPVLAPVIKQIETTRNSIRTTLTNILSSLNVSRLKLENNNANYQGSIRKIPGQERQLISIKRQQSIKESLYLYLLQKKEEAALSYASAIADSRTVDPAFYSKVPVSPKKQLVLLIALILGVALPMLYLYVKDLLKDKVSNIPEVNRLTNVPILGSISFNEVNSPIVVEPNSRSAISEQFRAIRTNLQFLHSGKNSRRGNVTMFTSSMSGEGKSFVATNLSAALSLTGKKTVLLEFDLRKPKISTYLNLTQGLGLSHYLIGQAALDEIIRPSGSNSNFYLISSGPIPPNPSELLGRVEMENLFSKLRDNFDEIIIDTPPIGLVTDAQILSKFADATIYLVRQGVTFKNQVSDLQSLFVERKFPRLNIILNGVKAEGAYGYGYGYGYGYYSEDYVPSKETGLNKIIKNIYKRF